MIVVFVAKTVVDHRSMELSYLHNIITCYISLSTMIRSSKLSCKDTYTYRKKESYSTVCPVPETFGDFRMK